MTEPVYALYQPPSNRQQPVIISVPHAGVVVPADCREGMKEQYFDNCCDADYLMDKVFDYASEIGATLIVANFSRFTVDLNRDPKNIPLYSDGRMITGVVPFQTFAGDNIYLEGKNPNPQEIRRRVVQYFLPYHEKVEEELNRLKTHFNNVLLYDAHSISRHVPLLVQDPLPDLMLGTNKETSASHGLIQRATQLLAESKYTSSHNAPFSGGSITRKYGVPTTGIHALQMERSQDIYLKDNMPGITPESGPSLDRGKVERMVSFEKKLLLNMIDCLKLI